MRKDMWDLDVTGMKSSHTFYIGTFDTVAEAEQFFKESKGRPRCRHGRVCLLHNHPRYFMEQQRVYRGLRLTTTYNL
jgi:hypothetical protein